MNNNGFGSSRFNAQRKRARAMQMLKATGMTEAEIETELAKHGLTVESSQSEPEIIDAEIVCEESSSEDPPMEDGGEMRVAHLPAVISEKPSDSTESVGRDWSKYAVPERRCKAHKKDGSQCKNPALKGATVCRYHGGAAKHVKMAARARLENATDRLAKELLGMATDPNLTPTVKLAALRDALDRGGLKATNEVVLSQGSSTGFDDVFDSILHTPSDYVDREQDSLDSPASEQSASFDASSYNPSDWIEGQSDSQPDQPHTAPADVRDFSRDRGRRHSDSDPLSADERRVQADRDRYHRSAHLTGEDALQAANEANAQLGSLQALPRGRS